jgi:hypothetical protein
MVAAFNRPKTLRTIIAMLGTLMLISEYTRAQAVILPLPPEDQEMIIAKLGSGIVGKALPSTPIQDVSVYFPLEENAAIYQVITGPNAGNSQTLGLANVRRPNGKLAWRFQFSPSLAGFLHETEQGDLMIPAVGDLGEGVVIISTPANPFMVKGMKPGESQSYTQQVQVNALDDPSDQEYSGVLSSTYTYVGTYQVRVPAGTYNAVLLRLKCEGKVGPAHTHDAAYYFFAPAKGMVAMISQEDATAFWIINIDTSSGRVLKSR